jgi:type IV fimbrial biogenesis protein FimT
MRRHCTTRRTGGFTLVELMVAVALVAVVLLLAVPSFVEFIKTERLKSTAANLVTDLQYARSEAVARGLDVQVMFGRPTPSSSMSCYTLYTDTSADPEDRRHKCNCRLDEGARCPAATTRELRTVQLPANLAIRLDWAPDQASDFAYDAITGGVRFYPSDTATELPTGFAIDMLIDAPRTLHFDVPLSGRPLLCVPGGATIPGTPCP